MEALRNIMAWAKGHPLIAGVIVLAVGGLAFLAAKAKPKTATTAADTTAADLGGSGGASDMGGMTPLPVPDIISPEVIGPPSSNFLTSPTDTSFASLVSGPGSVQAFQDAIRASGLSSSELTSAAVQGGQLGLLSSIRGAFPDVYSAPQSQQRLAQRAGVTVDWLNPTTPQADVRRNLPTSGPSMAPVTPLSDLMAQRVQLNATRSGTGVYYSPDMRGPGR